MTASFRFSENRELFFIVCRFSLVLCDTIFPFWQKKKKITKTLFYFILCDTTENNFLPERVEFAFYAKVDGTHLFNSVAHSHPKVLSRPSLNPSPQKNSSWSQNRTSRYPIWAELVLESSTSSADKELDRIFHYFLIF